MEHSRLIIAVAGLRVSSHLLNVQFASVQNVFHFSVDQSNNTGNLDPLGLVLDVLHELEDERHPQ